MTNFKFNTRRIAYAALTSMCAYVLVYAAMSFFGEYSRPLVTGRVQYKGWGLGIPDTCIWQPAGMFVFPQRIEPLTLFFLPLNTLDRALWHPDISSFTSEDIQILGIDRLIIETSRGSPAKKP